ncbi:MAG: hypothetical protein LVQ97_03025 [Candidatus Micrarchaeales archaeon]|jgi:cytidine deaminase|uniref:CMP/dCMP deaminase zinc-binding n=1 Tax=Candidatus Micrarchaeum acidiphilum ARMAN-2 TaxID=425595 RepID=C7DGC7_MICA2|nr:MAG: CMP/dCMP deaminase zinc-binding [Candidatus Micrarchaeum acidiphilum ARMAN-2]MCW6161132.1 hypothetical protein [Candidatus Micrarchaeales archaeon]
MAIRIRSETDRAEIKEEVEKALYAKEHLAMTFRSSVGYAVRTYDGKIYTGANIETYGQDGGIHAERMAVYRAHLDGYNGTDLKRLTGVFTDAGTKINQPVTPPCLPCQSMLLEFAHPYIQIVKADAGGNVVYEALLADFYKENPLTTIFPTVTTRLGKPRSNMDAKLPLNRELEVYYINDSAFRIVTNGIFHAEKPQLSISRLYDNISEAWSAETSADPERWSRDNPAWGQCAITAAVVYDHFGGRILRTEVRGVEGVSSHYYNQLPDGRFVDFTKQQFDSGATFENEQERTKEYIISYPKTKERYDLLLRRMAKV